jgi:GT2 family glycosyltransferase
MKICCVLVTYANRFHLLSKVVVEVLKQGVTNVVIVDNGSVEQSAIQIERLARDHASVILHRSLTNEGSAKGFKTGLEIAAQTSCEFIWILDDDNLPDPSALQLLEQQWQQIAMTGNKEEKLALLCMRGGREEFVRVLQQRTPEAILPPRNSFMGFHIRELFLKLKQRIVSSPKPEMIMDHAPMRVDAAPYGGLFIHKQMLQVNGLPDDSFVLYIDDFDFTYRITRSGGQIWLIPACAVVDIDQSFYLPKSKGFLYHSSLDTPKDAFAYYVVRNSIYFAARNLVTAKVTFNVNKCLFILFITLAATVRGKFKRLGLIYGAIKDGMHGRMGSRIKYKL